MLFDSIGINIHIGIGMILLKLYIVYLIDLFYLWLMFRNFCMIKEIWNKGNQGSNYFKDTM